jgi:integrase
MTDLHVACREAWTAEGLAPKTIAAYLAVLGRAEARLSDMGTSILGASATEVRALAEGWPRTRASRMQLRVALARAWEVAGRPAAPALAVAVPTKPRYRCRALPEPSAAALARTAAAEPGPAGLAVLLGLYAGLRVGEIAALEWGAVSGDGWLRFVGKGQVSRELPLHPRLAGRLAERRERLGSSSAYVFPGRFGAHVAAGTVWGWVRRLSRRALGVDVAPHELRHTAIATLHDLSGDLRVAQAFAGHARIETTVLYTRLPARRLEAAVAALSYEAGA